MSDIGRDAHSYIWQSNISERYAAGQKFNGVIFLRDINDSKMKGAENKNLRMFRKLCGDENMKNVVLVTTKWNTVRDFSVAEAREAQLKTEFFGPMIELGAKVARDNGTQTSAQSIVRLVLGMPEFVMEIVTNIMNDKLDLGDTEAGKIAEGSRSAHQKELEDKIAALKREKKEDPDPKNQSGYEEDIADLLKLLKKSLKDAEDLKQSHYEEFENLKEEIQAKQAQFEKEKLDWELEKLMERMKKKEGSSWAPSPETIQVLVRSCISHSCTAVFFCDNTIPLPLIFVESQERIARMKLICVGYASSIRSTSYYPIVYVSKIFTIFVIILRGFLKYISSDYFLY